MREKRGRKLYGAKKIWHELDREGTVVARCTVERLMSEMGIAGARARRKRPRTTMPGPAGQKRPSDLLERDFTAPAPWRRAAGAPLKPEGRPRRLRHPAGGTQRRRQPPPLSGRLSGQELVQRLGRGLPAERLAGSAVERGGDGGEVVGAVPG